MAEDVIVEPVSSKEVGLKVRIKVAPIVCKLLWAKDQDGLVTQLVVFNNGECGERFSQSDTIG